MCVCVFFLRGGGRIIKKQRIPKYKIEKNFRFVKKQSHWKRTLKNPDCMKHLNVMLSMVVSGSPKRW